MQRTPTDEYSTIQQAYDFYNTRLFDGTLPHVLVTLQRQANARGYFAADRFKGRAAANTVHELALNPDTFTGRTDEEILSTLVHEMTHVWQQTHGRAPRKCYHDRQWAKKMHEVGLTPSHTAEPGGKETGQNMSHYITPAGPFERLTAELLKTGYRLTWENAWDDQGTKKKKAASKTKFTCPECEQNAWGKPDTMLICGACYEDSEDIVVMLAEAAEEEAA